MGSVNVDLTVRVPWLPLPGETVRGGDVVRTAGGKGANQAVAVARLGADSRLVALTGDDAAGTELRAALAGERGDVSGMDVAVGVPTGTALILVRPDGENTITVSPGANDRLVESALDPRWFAGVDVLLAQLEVPTATCLAAARLSRQAGARVVLNAAPPSPCGDDLLPSLLEATDVLVVNEAEALALVEAARPGGDEDWAAVAVALRGLGPPAVVVTRGAAGAVGVDADGAPFAAAPYPVEAVDTVGAGDAFCAELAVALGDGADLVTAVTRGCAAGALATRGPGAQAALPYRAEVDALHQSGPDAPP
ncbi:MAG: ribokinase [Mycobacteriales bacterium]